MNLKNELVLVGCGKMGSAMLEGWLSSGISPDRVWILEPHPSARLLDLQALGLHLNDGLPAKPDLCLLAVKPQMMKEALPQLRAIKGGSTLYLSIAAGVSLETLTTELGHSPIIRAMPNTPAAIGRGITALTGNALVTKENMKLSEALLNSIGETIWLDDELQLDAVTALSGSGPAYVFNLIEALVSAGIDQGLPKNMATRLATATVAGAGMLAAQSDETAVQLRINVTSPGGTTQAGLEVLMDEETGLKPLIKRTLAAAADRSRALRDS